jgi:hypothetical protein
MAQSTTRVRIEYADQNEAFARCLPATGRLLRPLTADNDLRPWWVVKLDEPLEYQVKVGEPFQYRLITTRELVIGSRVLGEEIGQQEAASVHIYLPLNDAATVGDRLVTSDFQHVAWGICQRDDAA